MSCRELQNNPTHGGPSFSVRTAHDAHANFCGAPAAECKYWTYTGSSLIMENVVENVPGPQAPEAAPPDGLRHHTPLSACMSEGVSE